MEIKIAQNKAKDWDDFVGRIPDATIFHYWDWLKIVEKHTNCAFIPLVGFEGDQIVGVFPIFLQQKFFFKAIYSPPPKTGIPYLGFLLDEANLAQSGKERLLFEFIDKIEDFIKREIKPMYTYFAFIPGMIDFRKYQWLNYSVGPSYHYRLDLSLPSEKIFNNFRKSVKKSIKREQKRLIVTKGKSQDLKRIFTALESRYLDQGMKLPFTFDYLRDLNHKFKSNFQILLAKENKRFIGGIIKISHNKRSFGWLGTAKVEGYDVNEVLHWEIIREAIHNSETFYELIGANTPRLIDFKSKFNPNLVVGFTVKKSSLLGKLAEKIYFILRKLRR